jgi:hypothetical protein
VLKGGLFKAQGGLGVLGGGGDWVECIHRTRTQQSQALGR